MQYTPPAAGRGAWGVGTALELETHGRIEHFVLLTIIAVAAFASTVAGGLLALTLRDKLHLILGFSAGAVIGVAFFDLLPEALSFGSPLHAPAAILSWTGLGFLCYLVLERILLFHGGS